jgi:predicted nucleic acid-binding protein
VAVVVDASVVLPMYVQETGSTYALSVRESLRRDAAIVPAGWPVEVANAFVMAERRGRIAAHDAAAALAAIRVLPFTVARPDIDTTFSAVLAIAREHRLTAYDATYLELAIRERASLATLDDDLRAAAQRAGVRVVEA